MTSLAFYPSQNSRGKHDGDYFRMLAQRWADRHGGRAVSVDLARSKAERFRQIVAAVEQDAPDVVAFFCHGLRSCLPQMGVTCIPLPGMSMPVRNVDVLAGAIAANATHPVVVLFACSAGDDLEPGPDGPPGGDGGFADQFRDAMVKHGATGARVDAHDRAGDSVHNRFVRRFEGPESKVSPGGYWLVEPGSGAQWLRWDAFLHGGGWLEFPLMTVAEIRRRLTPVDA